MGNTVVDLLFLLSTSEMVALILMVTFLAGLGFELGRLLVSRVDELMGLIVQRILSGKGQ